MSQIYIDDSDESVVAYSQRWLSETYPDAYLGTRHCATADGQTLSLEFQGTGIRVMGILLNNDDPAASYTIDGVPVPMSDTPANSGTDSTVNVTFMSTQNLAYGKHTLVVAPQDVNSNLYWLDYFIVDRSYPRIPLPMSSSASSRSESTHAIAPPSSPDHSPSVPSTPVPPSVHTATILPVSPTASDLSLTSSSLSMSAAADTSSSLERSIPSNTPSTSELPMSPVVGTTSITSPPSGPTAIVTGVTSPALNTHKPDVSAIVGGVIGGIVFILTLATFLKYRGRRRVSDPRGALFTPKREQVSPFPYPPTRSSVTASPTTTRSHSLSDPSRDPPAADSEASILDLTASIEDAPSPSRADLARMSGAVTGVQSSEPPSYRSERAFPGNHAPSLSAPRWQPGPLVVPQTTKKGTRARAPAFTPLPQAMGEVVTPSEEEALPAYTIISLWCTDRIADAARCLRSRRRT
ncbi:hypothetical protein C8Q80DRAFT_302466 [Daedaleopsis nitida]|nr:hypothetical protein C8Q80DRAFT_302466 [Daedaleopsis nitida]